MADTTFANEFAAASGQLRVSPYDPTGLVANKLVINDDTFERGMQGWTQLFTPTGVAGTGWGLAPNPTGTLSRITRAIPRLHARTPNIPSASVMGIKRMGRMAGDGRYLLEFWGCMSAVNLDLTRPRWFTWGLDYELSSGLRRFASFRFLNYDEGTSARVAKMQFQGADGTWIDIPTPSSVDPLSNNNENKTGPLYYLAFVVNTADGFVEGFRFDDQIALGALKPGATAADISSYKATYGLAFDDTDLPAFKGGLNATFTVTNRSAANATSGVSEITRQRTTFLDAPGGGSPLIPTNLSASEESNWLLSNYPIAGTTAGTIFLPEIVGEPGAIYDFNILLDSINGTPTAGTIAAKFQVAPLQFHGYSVDSETSTDLRPWIDVTATDGLMGHLLPDGEWPAPAFSYNSALGRQIVRSIRCGPNARMLRLAITQTGITPATTAANLKLTVNVTRRV